MKVFYLQVLRETYWVQKSYEHPALIFIFGYLNVTSAQVSTTALPSATGGRRVFICKLENQERGSSDIRLDIYIKTFFYIRLVEKRDTNSLE